MTVRDRTATWLLPRLLDKDMKGHVLPVGGAAGVDIQDPVDACRVMVVSEGESLTLYCAMASEAQLLAVPVTRYVAVHLAWFILWNWWLRAHWLGVRLRVWRWCARRVLPAADGT